MQQTEEIFHKTVGLIIANMISIEYNGYMAVIFGEAGNKYLRNKCEETAKAEQKLIDRLKIKSPDGLLLIEEQVKLNSDLIFSVTAMAPEDQNRIHELIKKIELENKSKRHDSSNQ